MTKLSEHFSEHEFTCHHCGKIGKAGIAPKLLRYLERLRAHFEAPVSIMSGYRCKVHNKNVGGAKFSQHPLGTAADIKVQGIPPREVWAWANKTNVAGGVGRYPSFTHVDVRGTKARW